MVPDKKLEEILKNKETVIEYKPSNPPSIRDGIWIRVPTYKLGQKTYKEIKSENPTSKIENGFLKFRIGFGELNGIYESNQSLKKETLEIIRILLNKNRFRGNDEGFKIASRLATLGNLVEYHRSNGSNGHVEHIILDYRTPVKGYNPNN